MKKSISLSENLTRLMEARGLSISMTARKVGMNKNTLSNYCHGELPKNLLTITKLADFFEVSVNELIFGFETSNASNSAIEGRYELIIKRVPAVPENEDEFD